MVYKFMSYLAMMVFALTLGATAAITQDAAPAATLTPIPVEGPLIVYSGVLTISPQGELFVGPYKIAPAGAFIPSVLESGRTVIVVGRLLPDNVTIQAYVLEVEDNTVPLATATPTAAGPTLTPTPGGIFVTFTPTPGGPTPAPMTPTFTPTGPTSTPTVAGPTATPTAVGTVVSPEELGKGGFYCRNIETARHPVGERIANEFGVSYADVMHAFCVQRLGFGEITRVYRLAQDTGVDPAPIIIDRASGIDWAVIIVTYNIDVTLIDTNDLFGIIPWTGTEVDRGEPIIIITDDDGTDDGSGTQCQGNNGKGKGKCKDKDKGNNGKGNGKGNGGKKK